MPERATVIAPPRPLVEGERLEQPEFHRRYEEMPPGVRAELIRGIVYMPSPVSPEHADAAGKSVTWLNIYESRTPGVQTLDGATVILDWRGQPEPDALLRVRPEYGGRTGRERGLLQGAPELVLEVAKATRYIDLGPKLDDYERAGVPEYVVRALDPDEVIWHVLREGRLVAVPPGADGLYRSEVFPGLWLDPQALLANDIAGLLAALDRGLATPEHAAFVARLAAARGAGRGKESDSPLVG